jgi:PAS domain S-box-containing protein
VREKALLAELEELRARLREATDTLEAIRSGAVDAIVVTGKTGEQVYTLQGADQPYRLLVESINEGTVTMSQDGNILYSNKQFADMLGYPLEKIIGSSFLNLISQEDRQHIKEALQNRMSRVPRIQACLNSFASAQIPAQITIGRTDLSDDGTITAVIIDLSEQFHYREIVREEKLSRTIMENSPNGIAVCDTKGRVIRSSKALNLLCSESVLMKPFDQLFRIEIPMKDQPPALFSSSDVLTGKPLQGTEARLYCTGHGIYDISLSAVPLLDDHQHVLGCLITILDITERKHTEEKISRHNKILDGINRIFREAITCETEEALGNICLDVIETLTGSTIGFIGEIGPDDQLYDITISNPGWEACAMIDRTGHRRALDGLKVHGLYGRVLKEGKSLLVNNPAGHPDSIGIPEGHPPLTAFLATPLIQAGKTTGLIAVGNRDGGYTPEELKTLETLGPVILQVLLKKRAEENLKASETRFRDFFENAEVGTAELSPDGQFTQVNRRLCEMTGYSTEELLRMTPVDLSPPEDTQENRAILDAFLKCDPSSLELERRCRRKNGKIIWLQITAAKLCGKNDEVLRSAAVVIDISERKRITDDLNRQAAKLEAVNKDLESFSYSVSHDLRSPLRAVDGFSRMLLLKTADKLTADEKRQFEVIRENTQRMSQLIDDLLAFSRMGQQSMTFSKIDMRDLTKQIWAELLTLNPGRRMSLNIGDLPPAFGDRPLVRQVLVNLLSNAVKFTRKKEAAVIEIGGKITDAETIFLIRDNGAGFDMDYSEKLFGVFQRLHGADEFEGTGAGLAIVNRIIKRHDGRVWAEGKVDEGACFYFSLPERNE